MLEKIPAALASFVIATISAGGYLGIVGLMAIESACIPIPSEIIMPFSGYLVSTGRFDLLLVATTGAVGCNIGSTLAYVVGCYGGRPLVEKWGAYIMMSRRDLDVTDRFFARFGGLAVLLGRLLPVVRTFIALPAGIARLPQLRFQIYTPPSSARGRGASVSPTSDTNWASAGTAIPDCRPSCIAWTCSFWRSSRSRCAGTCGGTCAAAENRSLKSTEMRSRYGTGSSRVVRG